MRADFDREVAALVAAAFVIQGALAVAVTRRDDIPAAAGSVAAFAPGTALASEGMAPAADAKGPPADEARKLNAAIPFAASPGVAAQPFLFAQTQIDRDRAVDCLAIAAMAEAGDSDDGQRAVIQVILNRLRHPAFAKTVCGVVFQGSQRSTGCQFTFTCDGALARRHSPAAWSRARGRATEALDGRVYAPVGVATHYHTDWVHPYWSASLTKLARVETHLFFRWPGQWGSSASLNVPYRGGEQPMAQLAYLPAHIDGANGLQLGEFDAASQTGGGLVDVVVRNADGGAFVLLTGRPSADRARELGRSVCAGSSSCKVFGWFDRSFIPAGYPVPASLRAKLGFSYYRATGLDETVLYDCSRFSNVANDKCLPPPVRVRQKLPATPAEAPAQTVGAVTARNQPANSAEALLSS